MPLWEARRMWAWHILHNGSKRRSVYCVSLPRQRSMVQASTDAVLLLTELFGLCTCSLQGLFLAETETNLFLRTSPSFSLLRIFPAPTAIKKVVFSQKVVLTLWARTLFRCWQSINYGRQEQLAISTQPFLRELKWKGVVHNSWISYKESDATFASFLAKVRL